MRKPTPPPAEEPYVLFNRRRNEADQIRYNTLANVDEDEKAFNALLIEFDTHPVVILEQQLISRLMHNYRIDAVAILKDRAKAADRLFVELWCDYRGNYQMTVRNTGASGHLVANLLLIAKPSGMDEPLTVTIKPKIWEFRFRHDEGKHLLHAWLDWCRTDFRAQYTLNFGPDLNAPVEFDAEGDFK